MGLNGALGLGIALYFADEASAGMDRVTEKFRTMDTVSAASVAKFEANVKQFKIGIGIMAAGASVLGAAFALAGPAGKFEQSLADLQSISGATAAEFQQLREAALQAGIATQFSPTEAVNALRELSAQGFNAKESMELLKPALDLAAASLGELGVAEAAQLSAQMLKAFGIEAADAAKSVDKLLQASNLFALSPKDLPLALGIGSRGAQLMHQTLDETLISLGLVKNIIPTVERASTAVAVAMEHLAAPQKKQAAEIAALGLRTTDAAGKFLPFLDVLDQLAQKTKSMTQAQQAASLQKIFGAEALGGVQAILTQVNNGIKTTTGEVLTGAAAIAYLRGQMSSADGVAKEFADRRLDTFEGQKTLLHGSMETLAIAMGEPFAKALKPVVAAVVGFVNRIIQVVKAIPDSTKEGIAKFVIAFGGILTMFGALVALKAGIVAVGIAISLAGTSIAAAALAMAPILAVLGLAVFMFKAFQVSAEESGSSVFLIFSKVGLLFKALTQVFSTGEFSGAVLDELSKAENQGVKAFAIQVYVWVGRIQSFFQGLADGFRETIAELQPTFDDFKDALDTVAGAFGISIGKAEDNASAFDSAGASGKSLGKTLANIAGTITEDLTVALYGLLVAAASVRDAWQEMSAPISATIDVMVGGIKSFIALTKGDMRGASLGAIQASAGMNELSALSGESSMGLSREQKAALKAERDKATAQLISAVPSQKTSDSIGAFISGDPMKIRAAMGVDTPNAGGALASSAKIIGPEPKTGLDLAIQQLADMKTRAEMRRANPEFHMFADDGSFRGLAPAPAMAGGFPALGPNESLTPPPSNVAPLMTEQSLLARAARAKGAPLTTGEGDAVQAQFEDNQRQIQDLKAQLASQQSQDIVNHITVQVGDDVVVQSVNRQKRSNDARAFRPPSTRGDDS